MRKIRRRLKKKFAVLIFILIFILIIIGCFSGYYLYKEHQEEIKIALEKELINKIKSHYSDVVSISKDTELYEINDGKYKSIGTISKDEVVSLEKTDINKDTEYFKLKDLGYYVKYEDLKVGGELVPRSERYKKYLLFNENIVTKENTKLLRDGKVVYTIKNSIDSPIILKDNNGYYIEYLNELLFVSNEDVLNVYQANNTSEIAASGVAVTVYHFIFFDGDSSCNEAICHHESQIREHFNYLKTNNYFTMNTTELRLYLEGKLRAPKNSILITIDDGARAEGFIPLLEEYQVNATLFLISGWYPKEKFKSDYMELASHTHNLHTPRVCPGGQGSPLKCLEKTKLVTDLQISRELLNGTEAFCFPFYEYNDYGISALQEAGFKMGFIGGGRKATPGVNLYKIPRLPLNRNTTLQQYISKIS